MKKILFSALVIGTFSTYAFFVQQDGQYSQSTPVIVSNAQPTVQVADVPMPASDVVTPTPTSSNTTAPDPSAQKAKAPTPIPTPTPTPARTPAPTQATKPKGQYVDGTYTGPSVDVYYGNVQVQAVVSGGKITDVIFLDHPQERARSMLINAYAMPNLKSEAIQAQSANVDIVSGATATSGGFIQSLGAALAQAKA